MQAAPLKVWMQLPEPEDSLSDPDSFTQWSRYILWHYSPHEDSDAEGHSPRAAKALCTSSRPYSLQIVWCHEAAHCPSHHSKIHFAIIQAMLAVNVSGCNRSCVYREVDACVQHSKAEQTVLYMLAFAILPSHSACTQGDHLQNTSVECC